MRIRVENEGAILKGLLILSILMLWSYPLLELSKIILFEQVPFYGIQWLELGFMWAFAILGAVFLVCFFDVKGGDHER